MNQFYILPNSQVLSSAPCVSTPQYDAVYINSVASSHYNNNDSYRGIGYRQDILPGSYAASFIQHPVHNPQKTPSIGITGQYLQDGRRTKSQQSKEVPLDVIARRRAQNRASQRAYRNRKDSHIRSLESRLSEVKGKYEKLLAEHERCNTEHHKLRKEMDNGLCENERLKDSLSPDSHFEGDDFEHRSMYSQEEEGSFDELDEFIIGGYEGQAEQIP